MTRYERIAQQRMALMDKEQKRIEALVRKFQRGLALDISEIVGELNMGATDVNAIRENSLLVSRAQVITESRYTQFARTATTRLLSGVRAVLGLNLSYFVAQKLPATGINLGVDSVILAKLGFDTTTGRILTGSWLDSFNKPAPLVQRVATSIQTALQGEQGARAFKKELREQIVGTNGLGYAEQHFNTFTRDIYRRTDSATQLAYADALELNFARYAGVLIETSRPFCEKRADKIFSRKEIASWNTLSFQGKPKTGYDPFTDLGGYNCQHTLNWLSDEFVELSGESVDVYNA